MESPNEISKRVLTLKRTLNASIETVWEAWTQSEHIAQWWGPKGMEALSVRFNVSTRLLISFGLSIFFIFLRL